MCVEVLSFDKTNLFFFFPLLFLAFWVSGNSLSKVIKLFSIVSFQRLLFCIHVSNLYGVYNWIYGVMEKQSDFFFLIPNSSLPKAIFTAMCLLSVSWKYLLLCTECSARLGLSFTISCFRCILVGCTTYLSSWFFISRTVWITLGPLRGIIFRIILVTCIRMSKYLNLDWNWIKFIL